MSFPLESLDFTPHSFEAPWPDQPSETPWEPIVVDEQEDQEHTTQQTSFVNGPSNTHPDPGEMPLHFVEEAFPGHTYPSHDPEPTLPSEPHEDGSGLLDDAPKDPTIEYLENRVRERSIASSAAESLWGFWPPVTGTFTQHRDGLDGAGTGGDTTKHPFPRFTDDGQLIAQQGAAHTGKEHTKGLTAKGTTNDEPEEQQAGPPRRHLPAEVDVSQNPTCPATRPQKRRGRPTREEAARKIAAGEAGGEPFIPEYLRKQAKARERAEARGEKYISPQERKKMKAKMAKETA